MDAWNGWLEMRRAKGAKETARALEIAISELRKLADDGHPPGAVLDQSDLPPVDRPSSRSRTTTMDLHSEQTDWGGIMARALVATGPSTVSPAPSEKPRPVEWPTSMEEANALREWASIGRCPHRRHRRVATSSPSIWSSCTPRSRRGRMTPRQGASGSRSMPASSPAKATRRWRSWPGGRARRWTGSRTPKQCLDLIGQYQPPMPAHEHALLACRQYTHSAFGDWLAELRDGAPIGDVPDHWKRIAVEQGDLRRLQDGSYVSRALYHGPACRPYQATPARRPVAKPAPMPAGVVGASAGLV